MGKDIRTDDYINLTEISSEELEKIIELAIVRIINRQLREEKGE